MSMEIHVTQLSPSKRLTVLSLKNLNNGDVRNEIGNKALGLIKLSRFGYRIPSSLFLDFSCFDHFLKHREVAPVLVRGILEQKLGENLAIRSSSDLEDSYGASHAGFFKSALAIPNERDQIEHAITECYESLLDFQRRESDRKRKTGHQKMHMGVIIQPMIDAKHSGILFTTAPINPSDKYLQVQYSSGSGERLTGSLETGSSLILHKKTGEVIQQEGALQLSKRELLVLRRTAEALESRFDFPQDVEFAISQSSGKIFLLQSRPITAFTYEPEYVIAEEKRKLQEIFRESKKTYEQHPVLSTSNISEFFSYCTPLGFSIFKSIFAGTADKQGAINTGRKYLGYAPISKKEQTKLFLSVGDQARVNLLIFALTFRTSGIDRNVYLKKAIKRYMTVMRHDAEKANYPEGQVYLQSPSKDEWEKCLGSDGLSYYKQYLSFLKMLTTKKAPTVLDSIPSILSKNAMFYERELETLSSTLHRSNLSSLKKKLSKYLEYLREELCVHYVIIARIAFLCTFLVKDELTKAARLLVPNVSKDRAEMKTLRANFVEEHFNLLLSNENGTDAAKIPSPAEYIQKVNKGEISFGEFLRIFGHIGSLDIKEPRLWEIPQEILQKLFETQTPKLPKDKKIKSGSALEFYEKYKKLFPEKLNDLKEWIKYANKFMMLRETFKLEILKPLYLIKRVVLEMESRLKWNNELIYYLTCAELESIRFSSKNELRLEGLKRKAKHNAFANVEVGKVIRSISEPNLTIRIQSKGGGDSSDKELKGRTILHGEARGTCLFASSSQEYYEKLIDFRKQGIKDIIGVFKGVEPSYCYLSELKGMVTEHGGYLAHAATIAREYNIPYISNIPIAHLKDGCTITFDTANNKVIYHEVDKRT